MKIVDIKKSNKKGLVQVFLDNNDMITIEEEDYYKYNIYDKKEFTKKEFDLVIKNTKYKMAKSAAFKYIVRQLRSEKEVYNKLSFHKFDDEIILLVIDELKALGYLNDRMYAYKFVFDRIKNNPKSKKMLTFELKQKGIDKDIINDVMEEMNIDDESLGLFLVKKKLSKYDLNEEKSRKKIMSYLRNRGYNMELIKAILKNSNS